MAATTDSKGFEQVYLPQTFAEFWPLYLSMHSRPLTRVLHLCGTLLQIPIITYAALTGRWWVLAAIPFVSYGFAWFSHFMVEKNKPATFGRPLYSLIADYKMVGLMLSGKLWRETITKN
ncbi:MAG: DUF962 domain-containing protein [Blastocatellia bacterium]|nr:DUF962 domain-containing protein [Blastocatellia bacterium]